MSLVRWLRVWVVGAPAAAALFVLFYLSGLAASWLGLSVHAVGRVYSRWLLAASGVRVRTEGLEHLANGGVFVLAVNHLSLADTPVLLAHLPVEFRFLAKKSLFRVPIIGSYLRLGGHIAVVREDAREAAKSLAEAARVLRQERVSVLVFAEGTRSEGHLQSFRKGAAHLAIKAGVPVVPIAIAGTVDILPKGALAIRPGRVSLSVGAAIPTAGLTAGDRDRLTQELHGRVAGLLERPLHVPV